MMFSIKAINKPKLLLEGFKKSASVFEAWVIPAFLESRVSFLI